MTGSSFPETGSVCLFFSNFVAAKSINESQTLSMNKINYTEVPYGYSHCVSTACPLADTCLRALAWKALPKTETTASVLNPACITEAEGCKYYRNCTPVRYALGFTKIQKNMLPDQYDKFSNLMKGQFGRNPYFERRNGQHPMPPEEQQLIRQALQRVGVKEPIEFDGYKDAILW
jgi:hypothetical protein